MLYDVCSTACHVKIVMRALQPHVDIHFTHVISGLFHYFLVADPAFSPLTQRCDYVVSLLLRFLITITLSRLSCEFLYLTATLQRFNGFLVLPIQHATFFPLLRFIGCKRLYRMCVYPIHCASLRLFNHLDPVIHWVIPILQELGGLTRSLVLVIG